MIYIESYLLNVVQTKCVMTYFLVYYSASLTYVCSRKFKYCVLDCVLMSSSDLYYKIPLSISESFRVGCRHLYQFILIVV